MTASELATRLCAIANTNFAHKDQESTDLVSASKELLRLDEAKGGKWCRSFNHWISVNSTDCNCCHLEILNAKVFQTAHQKIMDILVRAELVSESSMEDRDIPEAVAAERKRCAGLDPIEFKCTTCKSEIGEYCIDKRCLRMTTSFHGERWRIAIMTWPGEII